MKDHLSVYKTLAFIPTACCGDESHKMPFTKINKYLRRTNITDHCHKVN